MLLKLLKFSDHMNISFSVLREKCPHILPLRGEGGFRNVYFLSKQSQTESSFDVIPNKYLCITPPEEEAEKAKANNPLPNDLMLPG